MLKKLNYFKTVEDCKAIYFYPRNNQVNAAVRINFKETILTVEHSIEIVEKELLKQFRENANCADFHIWPVETASRSSLFTFLIHYYGVL